MSGQKRENFGSKFAFVMAMAGSAIGLGNIWRFPYMVGEYGGAAFIIIYILCSVIVSLPIFYCESIIGRRARNSMFNAMNTLAPGTKWKYTGIACILGAFVILSYYSVVGGWSLDYFIRTCVTNFNVNTTEEASGLFSGFSSSVFEPAIAFTIFLALTVLIVRFGVKGGIEKFTKIATPALAILIIIVAVYSISLPGARPGVEYLVHPDWSKVTAKTIAFAMGQSFYSMSLGVGCVVVYSSFMKKSDNIASAGLWTAGFDTLFAIIAGFAIMPAVFAAGLEPGSGPTLVFETLPYIFTRMGDSIPVLSKIISIVFFLAVFIAALTSSISMCEVCVEHSVEHKGYSRGKASLRLFWKAWILGLLCCLSFGILGNVKLFGNTIFGFCDTISSNFFMTLISLATCIFVGWKMSKSEVKAEFTNEGTHKANAKIFGALYFVIKWVIPLMILLIFVSNLVLS